MNRSQKCRSVVACSAIVFAAWMAGLSVAAAEPAPVDSSAPTPSASTPPPVGSDEAKRKDESRAHFDTAISLFEQDAWDAALVEFQRSRDLYPTRAALKNAALCLRKLGRFDEALDAFEQLVRDFPNLPPADASLAKKEIADLTALIGTIEVRGVDPGALVVIDGRQRGTTPLARMRVSAGTHSVRVNKAGYLPFEQQVKVGGAEQRLVDVRLALIAKSGRLRVTAQEGAKAEVLVDGVPVGVVPWEGPLPVGDHTLSLRGDAPLGTQPVVAPVKVDDLTAISLVLEPLEAEVRVDPIPANATVALDGVTLGRGVWEGRVRAGSHRVEVAAEGFVAQRRDIQLAKEQRQLVSLQLERDLTSPLWHQLNPPRIFVELGAALPIAPTLGSDVVASCREGCTSSVPIGALFRGRVGYRLSAGLGFSLDAGYLTIQQSTTGRAGSLSPVGNLPKDYGTIDDNVTLRGVLLGASAGYYRSGRFPLTFRLGGGVLLGTAKDARHGDFRTGAGRPDPQTPFSADRTESASARYAFAAPEVRVGYAIAQRLELTLGLEAMFLFALTQPKWTDAKPVLAATDGVGTFGSQSTVGRVMVAFIPGLGARYEF